MDSLTWIHIWWWWMPCKWWLLPSSRTSSSNHSKWCLKWIKCLRCPRWGIRMCQFHRNNQLGEKRASNWIQKTASNLTTTIKCLRKSKSQGQVTASSIQNSMRGIRRMEALRLKTWWSLLVLHGLTWMTKRNRNTFSKQRWTKKDSIVRRSSSKTGILAKRSHLDQLGLQTFKLRRRRKSQKTPTPPKRLWPHFSATWPSVEKR